LNQKDDDKFGHNPENSVDGLLDFIAVTKFLGPSVQQFAPVRDNCRSQALKVRA